MTIRELIQSLANEGEDPNGKVCTIKSVDGLSCVCTPINGDADILDVRLIADESDEFFVLVPAVGSVVIVEFIEKEAAYISMVSKVSEVKYKIGEVFYNVNSTGFLVQKGTDTLKEIVQMIIESVQQILVLQGNNPDYVKLNEAMVKLNNVLR